MANTFLIHKTTFVFQLSHAENQLSHFATTLSWTRLKHKPSLIILGTSQSQNTGLLLVNFTVAVGCYSEFTNIAQ